jgi:hypothetical protein
MAPTSGALQDQGRIRRATKLLPPHHPRDGSSRGCSSRDPEPWSIINAVPDGEPATGSVRMTPARPVIPPIRFRNYENTRHLSTSNNL